MDRLGRIVIFYGDSNTYGYDPSDFVGGRFPREERWTALLQKSLGESWRVIPDGLNGRRIPKPEAAAGWVGSLLSEAGEDGIFAVMLGTNDLLGTLEPDAGIAAGRMDVFLSFLVQRKDPGHILLIAPVPCGGRTSPDPLQRGIYRESCRMNREFGLLARKYGVRFIDTTDWSIELAYDRIHFSREGHRSFARRLREEPVFGDEVIAPGNKGL